MKKLLLISTVLLASCSNKMILFSDDIHGYTLGRNQLPDTSQCQIIDTEFKLGRPVGVKEDIRWIDPSRPNSNLYKCPPNTSDCRMRMGKITNLDESQSYLLDHCKEAAKQRKKQLNAKQQKPKTTISEVRKPQPTIPIVVAQEPSKPEAPKVLPTKPKVIKPQKISGDTKRALVIDNLISILKKRSVIKFDNEQQLYMNFNFFMRMLVGEADVTDIEGTVITGTRKPIKEPLYPQKYPYQVQQVLPDMVILECGRCNLPPIGIKRVNQRPSPIEGQVFNDTRAIYKFIGTHHYRTILNERRQVVLFERISMKSLDLPSNYLHGAIPKEML